MLRLKSMAKSVFTTYGVPTAFDKPALASRGVRWSSSLQRISNSYTNWKQESVGPAPAIGEGRAMQKLAVLILTAVLADQLP